MLDRSEYGLKYRLYEIVNHLVQNDLLDDAAYVYELDEVRTLPPVMYPSKILNAAVNFYSHVNEGGTPAEREEAMRRRREQRGVPYMFLKPTRGALIGNGEEIVIRPGEPIVASVEGIGTRTMPVVSGPPFPDDLTGSYLPPVSTNRNRN